MAFAHTGRADKQDVLLFIQEVSAGEFVDGLAFDRGIEAEVEALECFLVAEGGSAIATFNKSLVSHVHFILEDQFQELHWIELVRARFIGSQLQGFSHSGKPQGPEVVL